MDDLVNLVNRFWQESDPVSAASYVLWRLNWIHPFINGNGRTARASAYFVLCLKAGYWLPGSPILPELIRRERQRYVQALKIADNSFAAGNLDLAPLHQLLSELLAEQLKNVTPPQRPAPKRLPSPPRKKSA